jgi:hypothetical protein
MKEVPNRGMVEVYTRRLVDACSLLRVVETASYPLKEYSSGEHKTEKMSNGGYRETNELVSLPIFPKGKEKGLLFGVKHTIFNTREYFKELGCLEEADQVIKEMKTCIVERECDSDERK